MASHSVALGGIALHAGVPSAVLFAPFPGPITLVQAQHEARLHDLQTVRTDHGVCVQDASGSLRVDLVEHVLAAAGGLGVDRGLRIRISGPEPPLLDGGALQFACAIRSLGVGSLPRARRIVRACELSHGSSVMRFAPSHEVCIEVHNDVGHAWASATHASWQGDVDDFLRRIAPARTYGWISQAQTLWASGRARGANTQSVIVLCPGGTGLSHPPPQPDECVRHKLLDLIGDLTLLGGVPTGHIVAVRPGHTATHALVRRAAAMGVFTHGP